MAFKHIMKKRLLIVSLIACMTSAVIAQQEMSMKKAVEYLASEELAGRFPGTKGDTLASKYIAGQLKKLKLRPIVKAKKKAAYYQDFTFGKMEKKTTHNIVAVLPGNDKRFAGEYVLIGAHYDHLGMGGKDSGSRRPDTLAVHPGADDNASSVAVVLELAKYFKKAGSPRGLIFAFFGAEEQGIVGSKALVEWLKQADPKRRNMPEDVNKIITMINLDMVGRMRDDALSVSGTGTSAVNKDIAEDVAKAVNLHISCTPDGYGPSDQASFCAAEIPVFYLTTGGHMEYHTPADKAETINYDGMQKTFNYTKELIARVAVLPEAPAYINVPTNNTQSHAKFKVTLGLMPDVTGASDKPGLRADIVVAGKPAHEAGIKSGDIIQEIDGKPVKDIEEYMVRLSELTAGTTIPVKVLRGEEILTFQVHLKPAQK